MIKKNILCSFGFFSKEFVPPEYLVIDGYAYVVFDEVVPVLLLLVDVGYPHFGTTRVLRVLNLDTDQSLHKVLVSVLVFIVDGDEITIDLFVDLLAKAETVHDVHNEVRFLLVIVVFVSQYVFALGVLYQNGEALFLVV